MTFQLEGNLYEINTCEADRQSFTSLHALMRVMQRRDLNEQKSLRLIKNAWEKGRHVADLPMRWQREYVENHRMEMYNGWTQLRVYQNYLFFFSATEKLITAYPLPDRFDKNRHFAQDKQHIRNLRKYQRMNPVAAIS